MPVTEDGALRPMNPTELGALVDGIWKDARAEWARLLTLQKRIEGKLLRTWMPDNTDLEYKDLFRKASSPWLMFARDSIAQGLRIDGYSSEDVWRDAWQASGMDGRQGQLNREVVGLGYGFGIALPAEQAGKALMRPLSALNTYATFADPWDVRPSAVLHLVAGRLGRVEGQRWMFVDAEGVYRWSGDARTPRDMTFYPHGLDYNPVARIDNTYAMGGAPQSSIEQAVPVYQRIVDATFTLQMVQRYGAFPQKWMAGGELAVDAAGNPLVRSSVDGLLHASGETGESARFGTFTAANLDQVVTAVDAHIKHFAALVQVPPHYLLGAIVNMSAEGIAAAESGYFRNISDRKTSLGEGYELWFRNAADILGDDSASDTSTEVHWSDESARSLAQISDAVVKLKTLDAPLEMLFALVPGWSKSDAVEAAEYVRQRELDRARQIAELRPAPPAALPPGPSAGG